MIIYKNNICAKIKQISCHFDNLSNMNFKTVIQIQLITSYLNIVTSTFKTDGNFSRSEDISDSDNQYCNMNCLNDHHAACNREKCAVFRRCPTDAVMEKNTDNERTDILNLHNDLRNKLAFGDLSGFQNASNMMSVSYSNELEYLAQCWSNHCEVRNPPCTSSMNYDVIGTNIAYLEEYCEGSKCYQEAMQMWYQEYGKIDRKSIDTFPISLKSNNFSQVIWADSNQVGCGKTFFNDGTLVVCHYTPSGNIPGKSIYRKGVPCTNCTLKCNMQYKGLCGMIRESDPFTIEIKSNGQRRNIYKFIEYILLNIIYFICIKL